MTKADKIFNKYTSGMPKDIVIPEQARHYVTGMMKQYAQEVIAVYKIQDKKEKRRLFFMVFGYFRKISWDGFILKLRAWNLKRVKRYYQSISNEDKRWYYIIRNSQIGYSVMSTAEADLRRRLRHFKSDVNAKKLTEAADYVVRPKK